MKRKLIAGLLVVALVLSFGLLPATPALASLALVALWHFDDNAQASRGNNNHGTVSGATFVSGKFGKALSFDGINDYVNVADTTGTLDVNRITIEAWIYFDEALTTGHKNIVRKGYYGDRCYDLDIGLRATGEIAGWVNLVPLGSSGALIARGYVLSPGQWDHVVMT